MLRDKPVLHSIASFQNLIINNGNGYTTTYRLIMIHDQESEFHANTHSTLLAVVYGSFLHFCCFCISPNLLNEKYSCFFSAQTHTVIADLFYPVIHFTHIKKWYCVMGWTHKSYSGSMTTCIRMRSMVQYQIYVSKFQSRQTVKMTW